MNAAPSTLPSPVARPVSAWKKHWKTAAVISFVAAGFVLLRPRGDDSRARAVFALDQSGVELNMQSGKLDSVAFKLKPGIEDKQSNLGWAFHQLGRFPEIKKIDTVHFLPTNVATLKGLKSLISFTVQERTDLEDADFEVFAGMNDLETLVIQGDKLTPEALKRLEGLKKLKTLKIGGEKLLGAGFERVCQIPNLEHLAIERGSSRRDVPLKFRPGSRLKTLRMASIDLRRGQVEGFEHLQSLEELYLWQVTIDAELFRNLKRLSRLKVLKVLAADESFDDCAEIVAMFPALESLSLSDNAGRQESKWFTSTGMRRLARSPTIKHLELFGTGIGNDGVKEITAMSGLKSLRLNRVGITENCLGHFEKLSSLETLLISDARWFSRRGVVPEEFARFQKEIKRLNKTDASIDFGWVVW